MGITNNWNESSIDTGNISAISREDNVDVNILNNDYYSTVTTGDILANGEDSANVRISTHDSSIVYTGNIDVFSNDTSLKSFLNKRLNEFDNSLKF